MHKKQWLQLNLAKKKKQWCQLVAAKKNAYN